VVCVLCLVWVWVCVCSIKQTLTPFWKISLSFLMSIIHNLARRAEPIGRKQCGRIEICFSYPNTKFSSIHWSSIITHFHMQHFMVPKAETEVARPPCCLCWDMSYVPLAFILACNVWLREEECNVNNCPVCHSPCRGGRRRGLRGGGIWLAEKIINM